jgi:hypothetical protein
VVDDYAARIDRARSELQTSQWSRSQLKSASYLFDLTAPVETLEEAANEGRVSGRRLLLVGGEAVAVFLAFAVLAGAGMRRNLGSAFRRMTWFGASRWQLFLSAVAEAAAVAVAATGVGWALGAGFALVLAERAGSPARGTVLHSVVSSTGLAAAAALAGAAALALVVTLAVRSVRLGALSLSLVDVAALGALAAVVVGVARGEADARALTAEGGTGAFLVLLPGLVAFVGAVALARVLAPGLRFLERLARHSALPVRFAALSLVRSPGHAAIAVAFLAVSVALALFAATYRSTLARGQADQARFAVPLDYVLREDVTKLVRPVEAATLARYRAIGTDVQAVPVLRLSGSVSRLATRGGVTLLGLPANAIRQLPDWRTDFAVLPPSELARRIGRRGSVELRGTPIPDDARELELPVAVTGDDVVIVVSIQTPRGDFVHVELGETEGPKRRLLASTLPERARGGPIVAVTLDLTFIVREAGELAEGTLELGTLRTRSAGGPETELTDFGGWIGVNGIELESGDGETSLSYVVTKQADSRFRPRQPTDGRPIAVVASPRLARAAGSDGMLPVQVGGQHLAVRVVAVARRFPSIGGDFVLADEATLATALNTEAPGTAVWNEVWLRASSERRAEVEAALRHAPFDVLRYESRAGLEADLRDDPLARAALLLAASASAALVLALGGLVLALVADLADERRELFGLEAEGAEPSMLRRHLRLRVAFTAVVGLVGGLGLGSVLSTLVVDLVILTANAEAPRLPLLLDFDWPLVALTAAGYAAVAAVVVAGLTHAAFRSPTPGRPPAGAA